MTVPCDIQGYEPEASEEWKFYSPDNEETVEMVLLQKPGDILSGFEGSLQEKWKETIYKDMA